MIKLDKNTISHFKQKWADKIKVFFYEAWCSGMKVDISDDFEISSDLLLLDTDYDLDVYIEKKDEKLLSWANITRVVKADHSWKEKIRYILSSEKVKDRCGCGSSFSFEKKKIKFDLEKLKDLKNNFKK